MKDTCKAMLNLAYFDINFPHKWEEKCFKGNQYIISKYRNSDMDPVRFILELSRNYQIQK